MAQTVLVNSTPLVHIGYMVQAPIFVKTNWQSIAVAVNITLSAFTFPGTEFRLKQHGSPGLFLKSSIMHVGSMAQRKGDLGSTMLTCWYNSFNPQGSCLQSRLPSVKCYNAVRVTDPLRKQ